MDNDNEIPPGAIIPKERLANVRMIRDKLKEHHAISALQRSALGLDARSPSRMVNNAICDLVVRDDFTTDGMALGKLYREVEKGLVDRMTRGTKLEKIDGPGRGA